LKGAGKMKGTIVVGHGSRSKDAADIFFKIVKDLKKRIGGEVVGCFMEISDPNIPSTIDEMYKKGIRDITILPYFLFNGMHIKHDIPEILSDIKDKYEDITISMAKPIEYHSLLIDILSERVNGDKTCI
jgi:sirohydrochlorin cobaltochelatase